MSERPLHGRAILVAEDEYYTADDLSRELARRGATVIGPAPTLDRIVDLIEDTTRIDAAVLDVNIGGEMVFPAADLLAGRRVPFLFTTGYDAPVIPARFDAIRRCEKPVAPDKLADALGTLIDREAD